MRRVLEECYDLCAPLEGSITEGLLSGVSHSDHDLCTTKCANGDVSQYLMFWDIRTGISAPTNKESYRGCLWVNEIPVSIIA